MNYTGYDFLKATEAVENAEYAEYESVLEQRLTSAQRKALPNDAFGLPSKRKYPLIVKGEDGQLEWNHLKDAVAYFHTCKSESDKRELAENIAKVIKKYNVDINISENNKIRRYAKFPAPVKDESK